MFLEVRMMFFERLVTLGQAGMERFVARKRGKVRQTLRGCLSHFASIPLTDEEPENAFCIVMSAISLGKFMKTIQ